MLVVSIMATWTSSSSRYSLAPPLHGMKRRAENGLENEQRLAKRFDLLNLEKNGKLWIAPQGLQPSTQQNAPTAHNLDAPPATLSASLPANVQPDAMNHASDMSRRDGQDIGLSDSMQVEDTPHRIYISDIDAELDSIPPDEPAPTISTDPNTPGGLIFLPDIEAHLSRIPARVLQDNPEPQPHHTGNELVLYGVPSSLSVSEDQDSVRKAIIDSRRRMTEEYDAREGTDLTQFVPQRPRSNALVNGVDESSRAGQLHILGNRQNQAQQEHLDLGQEYVDYDAMDLG